MAQPIDYLDLNNILGSESQPSKTWLIDKSSNRIVGLTDGLTAVRQACEIILNTERFKWQIYRQSSGIVYSDLIGADRGMVAIALQRRIKEALMMDDRVLGIQNYKYSFEDETLSCSFTVLTVFGNVAEEVTI